MKKGLIGAVIAAVVLMVLFPACGPEEVKVVEMVKASAPSNVSASYAAATRILTVKWEAAENAVEYGLYAQQNNVRDIIEIDSISPDDVYDILYPGYSTLTKVSNAYTYTVTIPSSGFPSGSYRFGISASGVNRMSQPSDIVWSDYINISY